MPNLVVRKSLNLLTYRLWKFKAYFFVIIFFKITSVPYTRCETWYPKFLRKSPLNIGEQVFYLDGLIKPGKEKLHF
jgi:hypothetical protein